MRYGEVAVEDAVYLELAIAAHTSVLPSYPTAISEAVVPVIKLLLVEPGASPAAPGHAR